MAALATNTLTERPAGTGEVLKGEVSQNLVLIRDFYLPNPALCFLTLYHQ